MRKAKVGFVVLVGALAAGSVVLAADHRDSPGVMNEPAADINDVYAWMSPDASRLHLAMTVFPAATATSKFSDTVQYVFHVHSQSAFGPGSSTETRIICTFDAAQTISCWVVRAGASSALEYVSGDALNRAGIATASGRLRVFAGLVNDPFFFNLDGFNAVAATVRSAAGGLARDPAGCPALDEATSTALVNQLRQAPGGGPPQDFFAALNTLAIVVSVDKTLVNVGGPILGVWASTHRKP